MLGGFSIFRAHIQAEAEPWAKLVAKSISAYPFACFDPDRSLAGNERGFQRYGRAKEQLV